MWCFVIPDQKNQKIPLISFAVSELIRNFAARFHAYEQNNEYERGDTVKQRRYDLLRIWQLQYPIPHSFSSETIYRRERMGQWLYCRYGRL